MTSELTHFWACGKTIFRIGIPNAKEISKCKNAISQQNLAVFSAATDSEIIIIQIFHGKGQIKTWTELSASGQEPTFKIECARYV